MLQPRPVGGEARLPGGREDHLEVLALSRVGHVQHPVGSLSSVLLRHLHPLPDRREVGRGVVVPPVALPHEHGERTAVAVRISLEEDGRGPLALHRESHLLQVGHDVGQVRVVKALAPLVETPYAERVVYLLVLLPARRAERLPRRPGLGVARLEPDDALPAPDLEVVVRVEPALGRLVQRHEVAEVDVPRRLRVERGGVLVPKVLDEHAELRPPVPHVVQPQYVVPLELEQVRQRVPDDGAAEVPHVHLLGDVGTRVVHHHPVRIRSRRHAESVLVGVH